MLIPKRVKFRRQHRPTRSGMSKGGNKVTFGDFGLQALEPSYITNRQIEAARIAINRHVKRGGKVWIQIFPDRPLTQKPLGVRMGSGKGPVEKWVANVKPGRILFEMSYPDEAVAIEALKRAGAKLPIKTRIVRKEDQY
ncbi:MAG: 50S ribosomal protein L16 [Corynebacterium sp.]|uniref:50S ribosomal protein L16 n=1 Tax=Corynebacterium sp. TaxID=1720 RepID=UPI0026DBF2C7|nr:50S ribosomal protein L16 [Corynebacterium sp.]MDO5030036.1 50S ribosomal protein L16 [Corynebacterium sp.]